MVTGAYRDLFAATGGAAGALTGLLFVAMSVAPQRVLLRGSPVIRQIRASGALLAFTNALAVSLYGLVPTTNIGYPALVLGLIGLFFTAAAIRSIVTIGARRSLFRSQFGLIQILLLINGAEIIAGAILISNSASAASVQVIGYAVVTSLVVGIGRAWEFIGQRDTGLFASLGILTGRDGRLEPDRDADVSDGDPAAGRAGPPSAEPGRAAGAADPDD